MEFLLIRLSITLSGSRFSAGLGPLFGTSLPYLQLGEIRDYSLRFVGKLGDDGNTNASHVLRAAGRLASGVKLGESVFECCLSRCHGRYSSKLPLSMPRTRMYLFCIIRGLIVPFQAKKECHTVVWPGSAAL